MRRLSFLPLVALLVTSSSWASTLVLPLQPVGLDEQTALVTTSLLRDDLSARGVQIVALPADAVPPAANAGPAEFSALARSAGADTVVYGSLSKLGWKIICAVRAQKVGEPTPFFNVPVNSMSIEDLDIVMKRIAEAIATGKSRVGGPSIDTITQEESYEPRTHASRRGFGMRAGFLFPSGESYGNADRLVSIRLPFKYETHDAMIETTMLTGLAWGGEHSGNKGWAVDWTILDLYGARIYGVNDRATYFGGGLGVHAIRVEQGDDIYCFEYSCDSSREQALTTLTADAGFGMIFMRTRDFQVMVDLRYHVTFSRFDEVNDKGAHGLALTFGTTR
jgi:hypothetical protein